MTSAATLSRNPLRRRQRGWAGLIVLLIALAIVGLLAKDALLHYGLSGVSSAGKGSAAERARDASAAGAPAERATATPATPIERARGVDDIVKRGADERARALP
jgi:hypothetical protein